MISKQLKLFILIRVLSSLFIFFIYKYFIGENLVFPDLDIYNGIEFPAVLGKKSLFTEGELIPFYKIPNPLFAGLTRLIGYTSETFRLPQYIALSVIANISFSSIFIHISSKVHSYRTSLLYSLLLGAHPYLALYSLKLDTSLFILLPIGLICSGILLDKFKNSIFFITSFSSLFRNAVLPIGWIIAIKEYKSLKKPFQFLGLIILSISTLANFKYALHYMSSNYGCYSISNINNWISSFNIDKNLSEILSYIMTPLIHFVLNLGARESISIYCLNPPQEFNEIFSSQYLITISFLIFHGWLLYKLIKYIYCQSKNDIKYLELLIPFSILLPTLYGTAHMRYLLPLIPMLLLFIFELKTNPNKS